MASATQKTIILIALIIFTSAATWFAWEISTFNSLGEPETKFWLHASEWLLVGSAILLSAGLLGEWPDSESWKTRVLYKLAKIAVILGVVGELLGDGGIFVAGDRVQEITDGTIRVQQDKIIELTERLAPRVISDEQTTTLVTSFKKFPSQGLDVCRYTSSVESGRLTDQLEDILVKAGWRMNEYEPLSNRHIVSGLG